MRKEPKKISLKSREERRASCQEFKKVVNEAVDTWKWKILRYWGALTITSLGDFWKVAEQILSNFGGATFAKSTMKVQLFFWSNFCKVCIFVAPATFQKLPSDITVSAPEESNEPLPVLKYYLFALGVQVPGGQRSPCRGSWEGCRHGGFCEEQNLISK